MPHEALEALALLVGVYGATVHLPIEVEWDLPTVLRELVVMFDAIHLRVQHRLLPRAQGARGRKVAFDLLTFQRYTAEPVCQEIEPEAHYA